MGFGTNYAFNHYGRLIDERVSEWLYGDWDEKKLQKFTFYYGIPGVHEYFDYLLDKRANEEYLSRYDMDYSDVHDPRKLSQTSSGAAMISRGYNMVSRNVNSLYRSSFNRSRSKKKKRR